MEFILSNIPLGLLKFLKHPYEWFTKWLFLDIYEVSDEYYQKRIALGANWQKLSEFMKYDIHLPSVYSNEDFPQSRIIFKASENQRFRKAIINVEVTGCGIDFEENIEINNLGKNIKLYVLPNIPMKSMLITENEIHMPYQCVKLKLMKLVSHSGEDLLANKPISDWFSPTYSEFLDSQFVYQWGRFWNLDEVKWQKQLIREYWLYKLIFSDRRYWYKPNPFSLNVLLCKLLCCEFSLSLSFWLKNRFSAKIFRRTVESQSCI